MLYESSDPTEGRVLKTMWPRKEIIIPEIVTSQNNYHQFVRHFSVKKLSVYGQTGCCTYSTSRYSATPTIAANSHIKTYHFACANKNTCETFS